MVIVINNQRVELPQNATLKDALTKIEMAGKQGIAAAVNSSVISKAQWDTFILQDNDSVLVIKAAQGG